MFNWGKKESSGTESKDQEARQSGADRSYKATAQILEEKHRKKLRRS